MTSRTGTFIADASNAVGRRCGYGAQLLLGESVGHYKHGQNQIATRRYNAYQERSSITEDHIDLEITHIYLYQSLCVQPRGKFTLLSEV